MDLVYFIILTSTLIFIHEAGHFACAKIFGVKVLTFSIGFGPKLIRLRGKETEYCLGLLPFGGFVNMLESSKGAPIAPADRARTFEAQALPKRIAIVLAGPVMNLVFPVLLYSAVFLGDRLLFPPSVGSVVPGKAADGKLRPGDRVLAVDGQLISTNYELQRLTANRSGQAMVLRVRRDGQEMDITVTPNEEVEALEPAELGLSRRVGRLGISARFPAPVIGVPRPDCPARRAGLRSFDRITAMNGRPVGRFVDLVSALSRNKGETVLVTYVRPVPHVVGGLFEMAYFDTGVATLTPASRSTGSDDQEADVLERTGIEPSEMYVASVGPHSGEWKAGLRPGDRLAKVNGVTRRTWPRFSGSASFAVEWSRDGQPGQGGTFQLQKEVGRDELGQPFERYVGSIGRWAPFAKDELVPNPNRIAYAVTRGVEETSRVIQFISVGLLRLVQGRIALSNVSGPITMYDVAGQAGARGTTYFLWAMALISLNLGLINLLPIPVLDGGHLVFLLVEAVRARPLSLRTREIASLAGMGLLVLLMLVAFKNDLDRRWDGIVAQVRNIFS